MAGDWSEDRLIPDLVRGFQTKTPVLIRRPRSIRPWQHVLEPLHGYMLLAERLLEEQEQFASSFNFGPRDEDAWPVERIATTVAEMWGEGASWVHDDDPGVHEAHYLRLDSSKAHAQLGWKPLLSIIDALEWTMSWYRAWRDGADMAKLSHFQINQYEAILLKVQSTQ